ncbi:MAG: hypothetical protein U0168_08580 [Nannocystaceae bacterium]
MLRTPSSAPVLAPATPPARPRRGRVLAGEGVHAGEEHQRVALRRELGQPDVLGRQRVRLRRGASVDQQRQLVEAAAVHARRGQDREAAVFGEIEVGGDVGQREGVLRPRDEVGRDDLALASTRERHVAIRGDVDLDGAGVDRGIADHRDHVGLVEHTQGVQRHHVHAVVGDDIRPRRVAGEDDLARVRADRHRMDWHRPRPRARSAPDPEPGPRASGPSTSW